MRKLLIFVLLALVLTSCMEYDPNRPIGVGYSYIASLNRPLLDAGVDACNKGGCTRYNYSTGFYIMAWFVGDLSVGFVTSDGYGYLASLKTWEEISTGLISRGWDVKSPATVATTRDAITGDIPDGGVSLTVARFLDGVK